MLDFHLSQDYHHHHPAPVDHFDIIHDASAIKGRELAIGIVCVFILEIFEFGVVWYVGV